MHRSHTFSPPTVNKEWYQASELDAPIHTVLWFHPLVYHSHEACLARPPPAANDESHYTIKVIIRHTRRPELGDKFSSRWVWRHDTCVDMCVCLCLWLWYVCQVP